MAKLNKDDVLKLARLSRLQLTEDEIAQFTDEISVILQYVEQLQSVDLEGVEPTSQVTGLVNVMRADKIRDYGTSSSDLLKNAPDQTGGHIKVKRVIQ